jgi:hypothetical protein
MTLKQPYPPQHLYITILFSNMSQRQMSECGSFPLAALSKKLPGLPVLKKRFPDHPYLLFGTSD